MINLLINITAVVGIALAAFGIVASYEERHQAIISLDVDKQGLAAFTRFGFSLGAVFCAAFAYYVNFGFNLPAILSSLPF